MFYTYNWFAFSDSVGNILNWVIPLDSTKIKGFFVCVWSFRCLMSILRRELLWHVFSLFKIYLEIILEFWAFNSFYFFELLGFLRGAVKVSFLLGYGPASLADASPTFWDSLIVTSSMVEMWADCEDETTTKSRNLRQRSPRVAEELMAFSPLEDETAKLSQNIGYKSPERRPTSENITETSALFLSDYPLSFLIEVPKTTVQPSLLVIRTHSDNSSAWSFFPVSLGKVSCNCILVTLFGTRLRLPYVIHLWSHERVEGYETIRRALYVLSTLTHVAQNLGSYSPKMQVLIRSS